MVKEIKLDKNNLPLNKDLTICLGFFDGVHLGHQELIKKARIIATNEVAVLSIDKKGENNLTSSFDRCRFFSSLKIDQFYTLDFSEIKDLTPDEFIKNYLLPLSVKNVVVGEDFRFGIKRSGDINLLKKYFNVIVVPFLLINNKKISSRDLVETIKKGDVVSYKELTNRHYEIKGIVVDGLKNGRKIGFPTANIKPSFNYYIPKNGVYKTLIYVFGIPHISLTNIGYHPTIDKLDKISIETHIIDFDMDIYGAPIYLEFLERIRDEISFKDINELKTQLNKDIKYILEK